MNTANPVEFAASPPRPPRRVALWLSLAAPLLALSVVATGASLLYFGIRGSGAYDASLAYLTANPEVKLSLGAPVTSESFPRANVRLFDEGAGDADFTFELRGSKDGGSAHVHSQRTRGVWHVDHAELTTRRGTLTLLPR
jgi:hypothetical protein